MLLWLLRLIGLLIVLVYASLSDYKTGIVTNKIWLYTPVGFALLLLDLYLHPHVAVYALAVAGTAAIVGFILFFAAQGKIGGADSKALICIGLSLPLSPHMLIVPVFGFVVAALLVGVVYILQRGKKQTARLIPYLTVGVILTCTVPYMYIF